MAPSVSLIETHFGTPDAVADAIHTITVDAPPHGKNYFDVTVFGRCDHLSGLMVRIK